MIPTIREFRRNLLINIQALSPGQRLVYKFLVAPFWSKQERDFFEGIPGVAGQLFRAERRALYECLVARQPQFAYEIGTFNGAGSTYFLTKAFAQSASGRLITAEIDPALHQQAKTLYASRFPELENRVEFLLSGTPDDFLPYLKQAGAAEFVFLDGAENADQSLSQFRFFEPWFQTGSILVLHDWETEKMRLMKEVLTASPQWKLRRVLGSPQSIGMAIYEKL